MFWLCVRQWRCTPRICYAISQRSVLLRTWKNGLSSRLMPNCGECAPLFDGNGRILFEFLDVATFRHWRGLLSGQYPTVVSDMFLRSYGDYFIISFVILLEKVFTHTAPCPENSKTNKKKQFRITAKKGKSQAGKKTRTPSACAVSLS